MAAHFLLFGLVRAEERRCKSSDVVVVDRLGFLPTIRNALAALQKANIAGTALPFNDHSDITAFAKNVARFRPRLVVAHYSMFAPGKNGRGKFIDRFFADIEASGTPPLRYAIYSSSLYDADLHPRGRTLAGLRRDGYFKGIADDRIALIFVPNGARFKPGNGDQQLRLAALPVVGPGKCGN